MSYCFAVAIDSAPVKHQTILREAQAGSRLRARNADGTFDIVLITEGEGSTAHYSAELMNEASAAAFTNVGSHPNHPADPTKPEHRNPMGMIGRVIDVKPDVVDGLKALTGKFKPANEDVANYVEQFADLLSVSVFNKAFGDEGPDGKFVAEEWQADWPYRSVDIVLAGGRGGRFQLAQESLRGIETSLGKSGGPKPGTTPAPGSPTQEEHHMDPEDLKEVAKVVAEALTETLKPIVATLAEQKTLIEGLQAGAPAAEEPKKEKSEVIKSTIESLKTITDAKLLPTLQESLIAALERGEDVTQGIEFAKTVTAEAAKTQGGDGYIQSESLKDHDWTVTRLAGGN